MQDIFSYRIPALHPLVVHFPIALSAVVLLVAGLWLLRNRDSLLVWAIWLQVLVALSTWAAVSTGDILEEQSEGVPIVDRFVDLHEELGEYAWYVSMALVLLLLAAQHVSRRDTGRAGAAVWMRLLVFLVLLAAFALIAWVSHIGGIMVWGVPV